MSEKKDKQMMTVSSILFCENLCSQYNECKNVMKKEKKLVAVCVWHESEIEELKSGIVDKIQK